MILVARYKNLPQPNENQKLTRQNKNQTEKHLLIFVVGRLYDRKAHAVEELQGAMVSR